MTWKQLTERDCREWKLSAIDSHDRDTWRSGARSAMRAASQLPGRQLILPLYLHLNKKSHDDDLCLACEAEARHMYCFSGGVNFFCIFLRNYKHRISTYTGYSD